jgi:Family of unknown function (DUF5677)
MNRAEPESSRDLQETVCLAEKTFRKCRNECACPGGVDFPSLALYLHIIRMADGVGILYLARTCSPMLPLLRSMLESLWALEYIHQAEYEKRSLAWYSAYIHQEIKTKEILDPATDKGKQFQIKAKEQLPSWSDSLMKPRNKSTSNVVKSLRRLLKSDLFRETEAEYKRLKQKNNRHPKWYNLFGGPGNIYDLADRVGWPAFYWVFYQRWSATVHGTDAARLCVELPDGSGEFAALRSDEGSNNAVFGANLFLERASELMVKRFLA